MPVVVGVSFRKDDKVSYYNPGDVEVDVGDKVICHMDDNVIEIGEVVTPALEMSEEEFNFPVRKIIRKATYYDLTVDELNRNKEAEGVKKFEELAKKYNLPMKLVDVHVFFDKSKMVFYFTSDRRVDFREMVKELASHFRIRIELRQIGVRDEAKIVGGIGPCGMKLCCKSFLTDFQSISIKIARDQNLPLNPLKISGICGRLMCCLKFEHDTYREFLEKAPEKGTRVKCRYGSGVVCGYEPLKESVVVELANEAKASVPLNEIEVLEETKGEKDEEFTEGKKEKETVGRESDLKI
ncbi:MAG: stage 0 sporulation protein [Actinobacteria bacterium]|nr:stage 0 sporulation protein [Actinomycetota bacterium]